MKKSFDGIIRRPKSARSNLAEPRGSTSRLSSHWPLAAAIIFVAILINSVTLLSAFEAHVINVTATIERRPNQCDALSPGYWRNHEGCVQGGGESVWVSQINTLSSSFSGVFAGYSGPGICAAEWQPNCPSVLTREGRLCRAKLHTLADELNLVSGRLDLNALIAGADRGGGSFDRLGLSASSTVAEALTAAERVIAQHEADATLDGREWLVDAAQVAERIYSFYEDENPIAPQCIFDLTQVNLSSVESLGTVEPQIEEIVVLTATTTETETTLEESTTTPIVEVEAVTEIEEIETVEAVDEPESNLAIDENEAESTNGALTLEEPAPIEESVLPPVEAVESPPPVSEPEPVAE
ncbi:MAG: hypothetical protein HYT47_02595 [Candidatus Vogelbacteria bacterium]|nr:hypothetical protein [Candidatus Vogelbacteria bacterium]